MKPSERIAQLRALRPDEANSVLPLVRYLDEQHHIQQATSLLSRGQAPELVNPHLEALGLEFRVRGRDKSIPLDVDPRQGATDIGEAMRQLTAELRAKGML